MAKAMSANDFFGVETQVADIGLIVVPGAEELANKIDAHLVRWAHELGMKKDTFIIPSICPRFQSVTQRVSSRKVCAAMTCILWWTPATTA